MAISGRSLVPMILARSFHLFRCALCIVVAFLIGGCAGGPPSPNDHGQARTLKIIIVNFGDTEYAQARSRELAARLKFKPLQDISIDYVTGDILTDSVDSEERAIKVGHLQHADVVVWSKGLENGSPQVQLTYMWSDHAPTTFSVPVETADIQGEDTTGASLKPDAPVDMEKAIEPSQGIVVPPSLGPLPGGPGVWDKGKDEPAGLYVGGEVHKNIAQFYRSAHPTARVFTNYDSIAAIAKDRGLSLPKGFAETKASLQPDIFNARNGHLYEIKSSSTAEVIKGLGKLVAYQAALKEAGIQVVRGPTGEPGTAGMVSAPGGYAYFTAVVPGLIVYRCTKNRLELSELLVHVLDLKHEVLQYLANAIQTAPPAAPVSEPVPVPRGVQLWLPWDVPVVELPPMLIVLPKPLIIVKDQLAEVRKKIAAATGLTGGALVAYLIVSEGSRIVFPPRNLVPVP
jgi:hypothetical protein